MLEKKEPWNEHEAGTCSPHFESSEWFTCFGSKKYLKVLCWLFMSHILFHSAHIQARLTIKILHALSCYCTKDHSFTSLHNQLPMLKKLQHSVCWGLIGPLQNTTSHFTQTQLLEQKKQSQQVDSLDMKQALGDVQCLRQCYNIWNWTNTKREKINNAARQRSMKLFVWKYFLIFVTRKPIFLSGMWNVLPLASDLVCA